MSSEDVRTVQNRSAALDGASVGEQRAVQRRLNAATEILGKKWHLVILHRLLADGPLGFSMLKEEIGGVSAKVLSESLKNLEAAELVDRTIVSEQPFRVEYSISERGRRAEPIVETIRDDFDWLEGR